MLPLSVRDKASKYRHQNQSASAPMAYLAGTNFFGSRSILMVARCRSQANRK